MEETIQRSVNDKVAGFEALCEVLALAADNYWKVEDLKWRGKDMPVSQAPTATAKFNASADIVRFQKTSEVRGSLKLATVTACLLPVVQTWANPTMQSLTIIAKDTEEYNNSVSRIKKNLTDYYNAKNLGGTLQLFFHAPNEPMTEWFEQGEKLSLDAFLAVGKEYRAQKRADAKAVAAERAKNLNLNPVTTVANTTGRDVPWISTSDAEENGKITTITVSSEAEALIGATDFYYLAKSEVKDFHTLSYLFPTVSVGQKKISVDNEGSGTLRALNRILGENSKIVFLPANRNMEKFKETYPNIPSIVDAVKDNLTTEWKEVRDNGKNDSYLLPMFWLVEHQSRTKAILLNKFIANLRTSEVTSLNADLQEIVIYVGTRTSESKHLHSMSLELLGSVYPETVIAWLKAKLTKVDERYPLLTNLNPIGLDWGSQAMKAAMLGYLKTC